MGKINVLDKHVAELIAAGEVVERPASVIKELVENAVDAASSAVTVEIKNGGVTFMRVTDNGCGIAREDVSNAFVRHATSKISSQQDLDNIGTLGFRGEALASIAAVAHVELLTRTQDELAGTRFLIDGDGTENCEDAGCAEGTTIVVRDLFYNTPARMKFLKKDVTEGNAVAGVVDKIALSHPEVSFRFLRDGRETLHTPGDGQIKSAVYAVYGKEFTVGLMPVKYELDGVKVTGFVSKPSAARPNRSMQNFFINGRYVKSRTAMVAMEQAFKGSLMVGKVPACVLYIEIPCNTVDVNVHPSKIEVRFINEKPIFSAVYHGVKTALNKEDSPTVFPIAKPEPPVLNQTENPVQTKLDFSGKAAESKLYFEEFKPERAAPRYAVADVSSVGFDSLAPEKACAQENMSVNPKLPEEHSETDTAREPERLIGEAFSTYIILERGDELVFIDKHAAHERILYEKLKAGNSEQFTQMLIEPVTVSLDKNEYSAVLDSIDVYAKAGFELEDFGSGTVLVRGAPMILSGDDIAGAVMEMAGYLQSNKTDVTTDKVEWLYHNIACRAAIKGGDKTSNEELAALVRQTEKEDVRYCPHGRPVKFVLKRKDMERHFGRIQ